MLDLLTLTIEIFVSVNAFDVEVRESERLKLGLGNAEMMPNMLHRFPTLAAYFSSPLRLTVSWSLKTTLITGSDAPFFRSAYKTILML